MTDVAGRLDPAARPFGDRAARAMKALAAVLDHAGSKRGVAATITCPCCHGRLVYSIARGNGHIHARCQTPGCVEFMQ